MSLMRPAMWQAGEYRPKLMGTAATQLLFISVIQGYESRVVPAFLKVDF